MLKYILCCSLLVGQLFAAEQRPVSSIWKLNEFGERGPAQMSTLQGRLEGASGVIADVFFWETSTCSG